jgi:hypothetical protein
MSADPVYLARLARYRAHLERQQRLGFATKAKLQALAVTEAKARNGELVMSTNQPPQGEAGWCTSHIWPRYGPGVGPGAMITGTGLYAPGLLPERLP